ncbi:MAG: Rrf2 family transcriptional regulator [Cyanobacteria bacterium SZAS LIN-2]|nr:Rrf2 family transcriptional regulator [Cyanobacteria bacterium SZAS LIN-2]
MISQTTEYALRAVVFLAMHEGKSFTTQEIAQSTLVPMAYLSKVLQTLSRGGIVLSQRGLGGGFTLAQEANSLSVLEVVDAVDPIQRIESCPGGNHNKGSALCQLHKHIDDAIGTVERSFARSTIKQIASSAAKSSPLCTVKKSTRRAKKA